MGKHAVVIGAGIGGLSAAQALSGTFEKIIVLERDELTDNIETRAGAAQGSHPHILLPGGLDAFDTLFDGFSDRLRSAGARWTDSDLTFADKIAGRLMSERCVGMPLIKCSRPIIEAILRSFLREQKEIVILDGRRVTGLVATSDGSAVCAVRCDARDGKAERYDADLVVDASGDGEPTLTFLSATWRTAPPETTIGIDLVYSTAIVELSLEEAPDFYIFESAPRENVRRAMIVAREDNRFYATLTSPSAAAPSPDWASFVEFATKLRTDTFHDWIKRGKLHGKITQLVVPGSRRLHYERCKNWPRGLVPLGDSICRLNPVYGQGMTSAAKQAVALRNLLVPPLGFPMPLPGLWGAFAATIRPMLDNIWTLSAA